MLLGYQALASVFTGTAEEARSLALRALGDGELLAATGAHVPSLYGPLNALLWSHTFTAAERQFQAALGDARERGSEVGYAIASTFRSVLCWYRGMLAEVEADSQAALARKIAPSAVPLAAAYLAEVLLERGAVEEAAGQLRAAGLDAGTPEPAIGVCALVSRAHVRIAQDRPEEALELLLECGRLEVVPAGAPAGTQEVWELVTLR